MALKLIEENLNSLTSLFVFASRSSLTTGAPVISQIVKPMTFHPCINYSCSIIFLLMHIKFHLKHVKFLCRQQDGNLQQQNGTAEDDHVKSLENFHCIADIRKQHEPIQLFPPKWTLSIGGNAVVQTALDNCGDHSNQSHKTGLLWTCKQADTEALPNLSCRITRTKKIKIKKGFQTDKHFTPPKQTQFALCKQKLHACFESISKTCSPVFLYAKAFFSW